MTFRYNPARLSPEAYPFTEVKIAHHRQRLNAAKAGAAASAVWAGKLLLEVFLDICLPDLENLAIKEFVCQVMNCEPCKNEKYEEPKYYCRLNRGIWQKLLDILRLVMLK